MHHSGHPNSMRQTELGVFTLDSLIRFVHVIPPKGTDEAMALSYREQNDELWHRFIKSLPVHEKLEAIKWHAVAHHELFHFHHYCCTRSGYSLFHYLNHEIEALEQLTWHPRPQTISDDLAISRFNAWAAIANADSPCPIPATARVIETSSRLPMGLMEYRSKESSVIIPTSYDEIEKRRIPLGAQRLFESWAFLWESAFVRETYGEPIYEWYLRSTPRPAVYSTVQRLFSSAWPAIEAAEPALQFSILNQLIGSCLNPAGEHPLEHPMMNSCGLKLYRMVETISELGKERGGTIRDGDVAEIERRLQTDHGYVPTKQVWHQLANMDSGDWSCSSYHVSGTLYYKIQSDFMESMRSVSSAAIKGAFNDIPSYFGALSQLPKPPLNFVMNDIDRAYDLRTSLTQPPERPLLWALWWFRSTIIHQAESQQIHCPLKPDSFFCGRKVDECGQAVMGRPEIRPVDCLFYRSVDHLNDAITESQNVREEWAKAFDEGKATPPSAISSEYDFDLFLAMSRP